MFRDDEAARSAYVVALERTAERVAQLEGRIRELEAEIRGLREALDAGPPPVVAAGDGEIYVDPKIERYVASLIAATSPHRTEGILSGARSSDAASLIDASRTRARATGRRYVTPDDVRDGARELLPRRIVMVDPGADPREIVLAIIDIVDVP